MQPRPPRLPKCILDELEGLQWQLISGRRHWRLMIDGIQVSVFGHGSFRKSDLHTLENSRANIRRFRKSALRARDRSRSSDQMASM
jgi:hypothetical protein